jgi:threonine dehydrogenase-like Zn-dependent dehydrogenase
MVLDTDPQRVAFARDRLGIDAIDISETEAHEAVADRTDGRMADAVIEAVGSLGAFKSAMRCARDGGRIAVVGVYGLERYELPMGMTWIRGLDLRFGGMANVHAHWDDVLLSVAKGDVDPTTLITDRLPLDDAPEGYERFAARQALKVVLTP